MIIGRKHLLSMILCIHSCTCVDSEFPGCFSLSFSLPISPQYIFFFCHVCALVRWTNFFSKVNVSERAAQFFWTTQPYKNTGCKYYYLWISISLVAPCVALYPLRQYNFVLNTIKYRKILCKSIKFLFNCTKSINICMSWHRQAAQNHGWNAKSKFISFPH